MPTTKEQFDSFHDANPEIFDMFVGFVAELKSAGIVKVRADEVLHRVRWAVLTSVGNDLAKRLKTLYGNRYAMELMVRDAAYHGFFDLTVAYDN